LGRPALSPIIGGIGQSLVFSCPAILIVSSKTRHLALNNARNATCHTTEPPALCCHDSSLVGQIIPEGTEQMTDFHDVGKQSGT
jgi:hypothetical protein